DIALVRAVPSVYMYYFTHPDAVEYILYKNQQNYKKGDFITHRLGLLLGQGLLTSEGSFWQRQRRLAQPAFHRQQLAALASTMTGAANEMIEQWSAHAESGRSFDIAAEMMRLTLRIASLTLFGVDLSNEADAFSRALTYVFEYLGYRLKTPFALPEHIPTP